jgi:serine/threonine protein kinase
MGMYQLITNVGNQMQVILMQFRHGKFNEQKAKEMFIQIVDALAHCYNNGYAHRDVKVQVPAIRR